MESGAIVKCLPLSAPADGETSYPNLSPADRATSYPNLSPADGESSYPNLSPADGESSYPNLSPGGGETQRGGSSQFNSRKLNSYQDRSSIDRNTYS